MTKMMEAIGSTLRGIALFFHPYLTNKRAILFSLKEAFLWV